MELIQLRNPITNMKDLLPQIAHLFPDKKMTIPPLNKKRMLIANTNETLAIILVQKNNGESIEVRCERNMSNPGNIAIMLLLLFGVIGIIIALIVLYATKKQERMEKAAEAYTILKAELE